MLPPQGPAGQLWEHCAYFGGMRKLNDKRILRDPGFQSQWLVQLGQMSQASSTQGAFFKASSLLSAKLEWNALACVAPSGLGQDLTKVLLYLCYGEQGDGGTSATKEISKC